MWLGFMLACPAVAVLFALGERWLLGGRWLYFELPARNAFVDFYPFGYYPEQDCAPGIEDGQRPYIEWRCPWHRRGLVARFDWRCPGACPPVGRAPRDPWAVFAAPGELRRLLAIASRDFDAGRADRVVVFQGGVTALSEAFGENATAWAATAAQLRQFFRATFYYVKDVELGGISTAPIALPLWFFREEGLLRSAARAIAAARTDGTGKSRGVLVTGSEVQGHGSQRHLRLAFESASEASWKRRWRKWTPPSLSVSQRAFEERLQLGQWAGTAAAALAGVEARSFNPGSWWGQLASFRFLACPLGSEVQTHKVIEALLVLTIPIVRRGQYPVYGDLLRLGFPLAIVDDWPEITPQKLDEWWSTLAPRLPAFRSKCMTADGYWRIFVSQDHRCL